MRRFTGRHDQWATARSDATVRAMNTGVLVEVVVPRELLATVARERLLVGVDATDMSLEMLAALEALATAGNLSKERQRQSLLNTFQS